jgi:hypothetical protein
LHVSFCKSVDFLHVLHVQFIHVQNRTTHVLHVSWTRAWKFHFWRFEGLE